MRKLLLVALALATAGFLRAQDKSETGAVVDAAPSASRPAAFPVSQNTEAFGDVQYNYDLSTLTNLGNASAEFDGEFLWFGKWSPGTTSNRVFRARINGTLRDSFSVSGYTLTSGIRDFAWDGRFMYGGAAGNAIVRIDTGSLAVVKTITLSGVPAGVNVRGIAYDPVRNGFWVCAFGGPIVCVDTNGVQIPGAQITNTLSGKYGLAYDPFTPGGPYLWAFDQSGAGQNASLYQYRLSDFQLVGTPFNVGSVITNAGADPLAGGLFIADGIVPGKATIGGVLQGTPDRLFGLELTTTALNPLSPFNLVAPPAGVTVTASAGNNTPVTISWDTSATGARYNWIFAVDSTDGSPRLLTIPSTTNSLTLTLGQIDAALAALGLEPGQSQAGFWTVWAYKVTGAPGPDSLRATTWRDITFGRQAITLSPFNLLSPPDNTTLVTSPINPAQVNIRWSKSGTGAVTYKWFFTAPDVTGSLPTLVVGSNNGGLDTTLTLVNSAIDGILSGLGIARGDSAVGEWRVFAYRSATDSLASTQTFNITLKRQGVGEVAILLDTTIANMRVSRDTLINYLSAQGRTFDVVHRGAQTATIPVNVEGYNTVVWLGEGTNVGSANTRQAIKDYLNAGTTARKSKVIVFAEDFGFQFDRTGSTSLDTTLARDFFGVQYLADRPGGNVVGVGNLGNERVINIGFGIADSVAGAWPEVFRVVRPNAVPLYRFQRYTAGSDSVSSVGRATDTYNTAVFGFDLRRIREAFDSPLGATRRALESAFFFVDNGTPLSASEPASASRPKEFKLEQNYPNPFNPTTTIQFAVPSVSDVKLEVFNILGQKVASLVNRRMEAGLHTVNFNAVNLSSGVYFYRLQSGSFVQTKKMMLVK
ncbi:MAG: T9SS type A sorting domain-containing protein [Chloroherpetonaceae bacterium]